MNNDIKKLQLVNPTKLNQVLDLLSSVYEREKFKENIKNPELSDVIRARDQLMESRKNKEVYGNTDQINFLKKLDVYKNKLKNTENEQANIGEDGGDGGGHSGDNDNDDDSGGGGGPSNSYDTQGQRGFHDSMQTKNFRKTRDGNIKLPNGKTLDISYDDFIHDFGKNISRENMYSLKKTERQTLLRRLKKFKVPTTSIRNMELREEYKELTPSSSISPSRIPVKTNQRFLPYIQPSPPSTTKTPTTSRRTFTRKRPFLPS